MDESPITGETIPIPKAVPRTYQPHEGRCPFLISYSTVLEGRGLMVVAAVGTNTFYGRLGIAILNEEATELQEKLTILGI
jgi:magnesium-transporting ATPase (P-type)